MVLLSVWMQQVSKVYTVRISIARYHAHRLDNIRHFLSGYEAIAVGVVQIECPVEQLLLGPLDQHGQGDDELLVRQLPTPHLPTVTSYLECE